MVLRHPPGLQFPPGPAVPERRNRLVERPQQGVTRVLREGESVAPAGAPIPGRHRVSQPARRMHDRDGPVPQAVELVQAAGLEPRRHQEEVAAGLDDMGQPLVEADPHADAIGIPIRQPQPLLLEPPGTAAEQDEGGAGGRQPIPNPGQQIEALLLDQPGDHADQRAAQPIVVGGEAERLQRLALRQLLRVERGGRIGRRQAGVGRRVPPVGVDAVQDPHDVGRTLLQDAVEAEAVLRRLHLARVGRADGRHHVTEGDAGLEEADLSPGTPAGSP